MKTEIKKLIETDLQNGLTYKQIMQKHNLKSNYLIKQVRGLKNETKYIKLNINLETLKKLNKNDLSTICAYFININTILKDKNTKKLINYIYNLLND